MDGDGIRETLGEALIGKDVGPDAMENLVKVLLVGGDVEGQSPRKKKNNEEPEAPPATKQLDDFQQIVGEFVPPAFNPGIWAQTLKVNTRLARCIRSFARNTVGLGWSIEPIHPVTEEIPKPIRDLITKQTEALREFFNHPNPTIPMTEIFYLEKVDEEATGNGYIEVVRNNSGKISKMFHVPSITVRRRIIREEGKPVVSGFVQIRGSQKRYFKDFGDKRVMDAFNGKYHDGKEPLSADHRATEILHFLVYDPGSSYYGAPRYIPAATAIAGNRQAAIRNVNFFENDAVPRMALLISGGKLTGDSVQQIEDFVRAKGRGVENAHRVMIVQVEPIKVGFQQQNKVMVDLKPLTVGVTEDASFSQYREANDEEVREIFGLGQIFFKAEGANRANAQVCLAGHVSIPLLDGRVITMRDLTREFADGRRFAVYSLDHAGNVVCGWAHHPRKTKTDQTYDVILDSGQAVRANASHPFMLRDGTYCPVGNLRPGMSLMPWYVRMGFKNALSVDASTYGYWEIYNPASDRWDLVHRRILAGEGVDLRGMSVHHRDGNPLNNDLSNLDALTCSEHIRLHKGGRRGEYFGSDHPGFKHFDFDEVVRVAATCGGRPTLLRRLEIGSSALYRVLKEHGLTYEEFRWKHMGPKNRPPGGRSHTRFRKDASFEHLAEKAPGCRYRRDLISATGYSANLILRLMREHGYDYARFRAEFMGMKAPVMNHRVVAVVPAGIEDVFDLTVDRYENFAVAAGVFVHNSREITNEQELEPDRLSKEYVINQTIVEDILFQQMGVTGDESPEEVEEFHKNIHVRFRFARLTLTDPLDEARMNQMYASLGAITPNELRESLGKPPFPKDYYFADKPLAIAMAELTAGLALAIAQKDEEKMPQVAAPGAPPGVGVPGEEGVPPEGVPAEEEPEEEEAPPDEMNGREPKGVAGMPPIPGAPGATPIPGLQVMPKPGGVKKPLRKPRPPKPTQGIASLHGVPVSSRKTMVPNPQAFGILSELMSDIRKFALAGVSFAKGDGDGQGR